MFEYTAAEAANSLIKAKNLNAAIKKLIKLEGEKDERTLRFVKSFKAIAKMPKEERLADFITKALPNYKEHLYIITRNAFFDETEVVLEQLIDTYAEKFNETYDHDGSGVITVKDQENFKKIAKDAINQMSKLIESSSLPNNNFLKATITYTLFDRAVLEELKKHF